MLYATVLAILGVVGWPRLVSDPLGTLGYGLVAVVILQLAYSIARSRAPFPSFLAAVLALFLTPAIFTLLFLFGAPIRSSVGTLLMAAHFSVLALQPALALHGISGAYWLSVITLTAPPTDVFGSIVGTALGSWIGAIPIALDWDRPWQAWPITVVAGGYLGSALGSIFGALIGGYDKAERQGARKPVKSKNDKASSNSLAVRDDSASIVPLNTGSLSSSSQSPANSSRDRKSKRAAGF